MSSFSTSPLPYVQATASQRTQLVHYLQARLQPQFPTLPTHAFVRALAEFRPALWFIETQVTLTPDDLFQLVQYLGYSPELPQLDPPLFCRPALELAQYVWHTNELTVSALTELASTLDIRCGPRLGELLRHTAWLYPLAEQVVQSQRWDLPGSPRLLWGIPGGGSAPGSLVVERLLQHLAPLAA